MSGDARTKPDDKRREPDRLGVLAVGIVTHLWKHPKHVPGCDICQHIKTGKWPE
jgi:hypothetical protein